MTCMFGYVVEQCMQIDDFWSVSLRSSVWSQNVIKCRDMNISMYLLHFCSLGFLSLYRLHCSLNRNSNTYSFAKLSFPALNNQPATQFLCSTVQSIYRKTDSFSVFFFLFFCWMSRFFLFLLMMHPISKWGTNYSLVYICRHFGSV